MPRTAKVVDRRYVTFKGTTDVTSRRNTVAAYRATSDGARIGPAVATKRAGTDGAWSMSVPLDPNRRNRIVVQAIDPSGNRSHIRPRLPYTVIEDSKRPVVRLYEPDAGETLYAVKRLRWRTSEANKGFARLQYKKRSSSQWRTIDSRTADDGYFRWELPRKRLRGGGIFAVRVMSQDVTGKRDWSTVGGLRAKFPRR